MTKNNSDLAKAYEFSGVEKKWSRRWLKEKQSRATMDPDRPSFSMVIPPPNVTGVLHVGHALNNTLQDVLIRYKRMMGYNTLWVPGTDHAGIATQNVVEKQLAKENLKRHDLGRDAFLEKIWEWKASSGGEIISQLKRLGCSCDWDRERFTMDEGLSRAVRTVFCRLYKEGLIYKGDYIINWCPRCHTALADLEVEHEDTAGKLYRIRYPLASGDGCLVVATTRPETMLGDTGVAVHPEDERYSRYRGEKVILPLLEKKIPLVFDEQVEREFGTGALKITPAHDLNDFEIGRRHDLKMVKVMDIDGRMNVEAGPYAGMNRFVCREKVVEDLEKAGLLESIEEYQHGVGHCYRCSTVVEPTLSDQWFVSVKPLAEKALQAVENDEIRIHPKWWYKTFYEWINNIRDWCISRQIWWGHQIPAWTCEKCGQLTVREEEPVSCPNCGSHRLVQETDVLDTWFSSALWPFSTLGWPDDTEELNFFYPTSVLITSFDILFFWVCRMMMMGLHFMDEVPFRDVYLHALVRDAYGRKMSKSKGNVMDPVTLMDRYGADAFRFTMIAFAAQGRDIRLSEERIEGYRHFINKIWNAARFSLMHLDNYPGPAKFDLEPSELGLPHRWILDRLNQAVKEVHQGFSRFRFNEAAAAMYQFVWGEFCDWYLEMIKPELYGSRENDKARQVLLHVLRQTLKLLHPVIPFITEELWQALPGEEKSIMTAPYPEVVPAWSSPEVKKEVSLIMIVVSGIRNIRSEMQIHPGKALVARVICPDQQKRKVISSHEQVIKELARTDNLDILAEGPVPKGSASYIAEDMEISVPLEGLIDVDRELAKLNREKAKTEKELRQARGKLGNEKFLTKAPDEVIAKEKKKEAALDATMTKLEERYKRLKEISKC
ncbi:MAG: valine--tRNA ligase [Desulfobia sp.]